MMGFCKCFHTLLGFRAADEPLRKPPHHRCWSLPPSGSEGLRLFAAEPWGPPPLEMVDASARGLHECCYGEGLGLCTESLGSESCDGGLEEEEAALEASAAISTAVEEKDDLVDEEVEEGRRWTRMRPREDRKVFPPPLRWLGGMGGRCTCFMQSERKEGRLILTEVQIERPEIFSISRKDGRLKLHLIESDVSDELATEGEVETPALAEENEKAILTEEEEEKAMAEEEEEKDEEGRTERWEWRRGEGYRSCQEAVGDHNEVPVWWDHLFLTTAG